MRRVARENTAPELRLRRALWRAGLRYRVHRNTAGTTPDIVFVRSRIAVFVDGCFWHGCPDHYVAPKNNADFWRQKIERNQARDRRNEQDLESQNWRVLRFWECEVNRRLDRVVREVSDAVSIDIKLQAPQHAPDAP